jgi:general transcription factor 3C polypeptide 1
LIELVNEHVEDSDVRPRAVTTYSLEIRPYIEEPTPRVIPSSHVSVNHHPKFRHDFVLSKLESVDAYWETLKYCYLTAGLADQNAFPGNCVPEVCHLCYAPSYFIYLYIVIKEGTVGGVRSTLTPYETFFNWFIFR